MRNLWKFLILALLAFSLSACSPGEEPVPLGDFIPVRILSTREADTEPGGQTPGTAAPGPEQPGPENPGESAATDAAQPGETEEEALDVADGIYRNSAGDIFCYIGGRRFKGWVETTEGYWYFGADGRRVEGWQEIGSGLYYFLDGRMLTGDQTVDEEPYRFGSDGRAVNGWQEEAGERYYYTGGVRQRGIVVIDGSAYYLDPEDGRLRTDAQLQYYADADGILRPVETEGESGYVTFDVINEDNLEAYLQYLLDTFGRDPYSIYCYVRDNFQYRQMSMASETTMLLRFINTGVGACFDFVTLTSALLNRAGYSTKTVRGHLGHRWLLVQMSPGVWRHMDTMRNWVPAYNLTDDELAEYDGFLWDRTYWTSQTSWGANGENPPEVQAYFYGD